jgi:D-alanyl-D-alanine carboxypeptidase
MNKELLEAIKVTGKIVDYWLPLKIGYDHTPGAVVCIAVNGVPQYLKSFGFSNIKTETKLKANAQFRVASMSKMFTAVAIMQQQEKGLLRLDDKVVDHLSWFSGKNKETDLKNVTIRQLLSHTSGIFRDGIEQQWITDKFPSSLEGTINASSIVFDNGITTKYSNHGYATLGAVIEKVSGQTYSNYIKENIILPLKLKDTLPDFEENSTPKLTPGYKRWIPDQTERDTEPNIKTNAYAPATGFVSTANDLAVFLAAINTNSKRNILCRESRKAMQQIQGLINSEESYGLGLIIETTSGQNTYGHSGGFAGYVTNAISHREDNIQVIVLTNTQSPTAGLVADSTMRMIYNLKNTPGVKFINNDPYSGIYRNRWIDTSVVTTGEEIVTFSPATPNPVNFWSKYKKVKSNIFKNQDKTGFGTPGETFKFQKIKGGKSMEIKSDAMNSERIY